MALERRPDWWPRWVPIRCGRGHLWLPGTVTGSYVHCPDCPVAAEADGRGHYVWICAADGCHWEVPPEGCPRPTGVAATAA